MGIWVKQSETDWVTSETRTSLTRMNDSIYHALKGTAHEVLAWDRQVWLGGRSQYPLHPTDECPHCSAQAAGDLPAAHLNDQVPKGVPKSLFILLSVSYVLRTKAR